MQQTSKKFRITILVDPVRMDHLSFEQMREGIGLEIPAKKAAKKIEI
jgi:hypothetical protein